jgi:hypothetical protein
MKIEIANRRKTRKFSNMWRIDNTILNSQKIKEITRGIRKQRQKKIQTQNTKVHGL